MIDYPNLKRMDLALRSDASMSEVVRAVHDYITKQTLLNSIYLLVLPSDLYERLRYTRAVTLGNRGSSHSALDHLTQLLASLSVRIVPGDPPAEGVVMSAVLRPGEAITMQVDDDGGVRVAACATDIARNQLIDEAERAGILLQHEAADRRDQFRHKYVGEVIEDPTDERVADAIACALAAVRKTDFKRDAVKP